MSRLRNLRHAALILWIDKTWHMPFPYLVQKLTYHACTGIAWSVVSLRALPLNPVDLHSLCDWLSGGQKPGRYELKVCWSEPLMSLCPSRVSWTVQPWRSQYSGPEIWPYNDKPQNSFPGSASHVRLAYCQTSARRFVCQSCSRMQTIEKERQSLMTFKLFKIWRAWAIEKSHTWFVVRSLHLASVSSSNIFWGCNLLQRVIQLELTSLGQQYLGYAGLTKSNIWVWQP